MGWDKNGRYYTRSKRVNGKVVREHIGGGEAGRLAAEQDALEREKRQAERAAANAQRAKLAVLYAQMDELNELVDLVFRTYLMALGYRQHHRGEWRKRRVRRQETPVQPCDAAQHERPVADNVEVITQEQPHGPAGIVPTPTVTLRMMFLTKPKIAVADAPDRFPLQQNGGRRGHLRTGRGQAGIAQSKVVGTLRVPWFLGEKLVSRKVVGTLRVPWFFRRIRQRHTECAYYFTLRNTKPDRGERPAKFDTTEGRTMRMRSQEEEVARHPR